MWENNNYFGIKCFFKSCCKGYCINFNDDYYKDFFCKFIFVEESYVVYSKVLEKSCYSLLFCLKIIDYKGWVCGLCKVGYVIDLCYVDKFI